MNKKIIILLSLVLLLFLSLTVYLSVFGVTKAKTFKKSVYNQRLYAEEQKVMRGTIYDKSGTVLAESRKEGEEIVRVYPYGKLYTHVIGYDSKTYGKTKIELSYNDYLSGGNELSKTINLMGAVSGKTPTGMDVILTVDHELQSYAEDVLGKKNGSIIVLEPATGAVRAMVSHPTFEPSSKALDNEWGTLTEGEDAPFVARAVSGLYAPGSTWKIVTAAAAIEQGLGEETFDDEGRVFIAGREYTNSHETSFGTLTLSEAFAASSNVVFALLGDRMGERGTDIYEQFLLGKDIRFDIPLATSYLANRKHMSKTDIASTAIGQGQLLVTPLYMTLVASIIASDGRMMEPYLVERVEKDGMRAYQAKPKGQRILEEDTARRIKDMMALCVSEGTGRSASVPGISVFGKTGTAQNETDQSHDWFVGFAENEAGQCVAVCVMLEYNGEGSNVSAAMAGRIFRKCFN